MLTRTTHYVENDLFLNVTNNLFDIDFKLSINKPTGDFFYDPWVIKDEYKNTIWEQLYDTLDANKGEARLIKLTPGTSYTAHADMDNRWHLNLKGKECYLIDLDDKKMHPLVQDQYWYYMNAGKYHTAANFGNRDRIQLVVRELFEHKHLLTPVPCTIKVKTMRSDYRYEFDRIVSPWLNNCYKLGLIDNFKYINETVSFDTEPECKEHLKQRLPDFLELI